MMTAFDCDEGVVVVGALVWVAAEKGELGGELCSSTIGSGSRVGKAVARTKGDFESRRDD
jgi:hypothetical protein